jgi:hypothetical protein
MKKSLALALVLFLPAALSAQNWLSGSLDDALAKSKTSGKPILIDFFREVG